MHCFEYKPVNIKQYNTFYFSENILQNYCDYIDRFSQNISNILCSNIIYSSASLLAPYRTKRAVLPHESNSDVNIELIKNEVFLLSESESNRC